MEWISKAQGETLHRLLMHWQATLEGGNGKFTKSGLMFDGSTGTAYNSFGYPIVLDENEDTSPLTDNFAVYRDRITKEADKLLLKSTTGNNTGKSKTDNCTVLMDEDAIVGTNNAGESGRPAKTISDANNDTEMILIDEDRLVQLVKSTGIGSQDWEDMVRYAAQLTNLQLPFLAPFRYCGKMFVQQLIHSCVAALFVAFRPKMYCAGDDDVVTCLETIDTKPDVDASDGLQFGGRRACAAHCKPDAGIRLSDFYVIAMMELKSYKDNALEERDPYKCIVMTAMSLLAIEKVRKANPVSADNALIETAIPFILGKHSLARLYVMHLVDGRPKVQWLCSMVAGSSSSEDKSTFMAMLAVALGDIVRICNLYERSFHEKFSQTPVSVDDLVELPNALSPAAKHYKARSAAGSDNEPNKKAKASHPVNSGGQPKDEHGSGPTDKKSTGDRPNSAEHDATVAASRFGLVRQLYPRRGTVFKSIYSVFPEQELHAERDQQQKSPFCFVGTFGRTGVFCKVWRVGDEDVYWEHIAREIELNQRANDFHVPSATVIDGLTEMNVAIDGKGGGGVADGRQHYHILVTKRHREDAVATTDYALFAVSLVRAVIKLHSNGILHCDIKPGNILWDEEEKVVRLVDFGHAHWERKETRYESTVGFMAPEVESGDKPHSRLSDAFSVGKTLEGFYLKAAENKAAIVAAFGTAHAAAAEGDDVADKRNSAIMDAVVNPLTNESLDNRMGLSAANEWLESNVPGAVGQSAQGVRNEDQTGV